MPIGSKQLAELSTSKFQPFIKVLMHNLYDEHVACCKEFLEA